MRLVLDASAAVNALIPSELRDRTRERFVGADLCAPTLIDTEVLSTLARLQRAGSLSTSEADRALLAWQRLPLTRLPINELLGEVWALRHAVRINDAHYVVAARVLAAPLLTADLRLARTSVPALSVLTVT